MENQEFIKSRNPAEYLKIFFRRRWMFIAPVFIGLVLSIIACFLLPPTFESSTVIIVEEEKIINPLIQGLAVSTNVIQRMQTIREILLGWNSLVELTKKLNLAKDVQTQLQFENLIMGLRKNIIVRARGDNLFQIVYQGKNPAETQLVTKTLTDILVDENKRTQTKETDVAIEFIKEQLQVYKRKIKESEIADLEEQLKKLLADSTEQHPMVKELRQKVTLAKKDLGSQEYTPSDPSEQPVTAATYDALKQELDKIIKQETDTGSGSLAYAANNDDPNTKIYKLMLMDKLDSVLARDMRVNENIYNMLLQKLETAKITQRLEASKSGTRYTIIDPPRLPLRPVKPNKFKVVLLGLFAGMASGAGLVFGREFMDRSFMDIEDAKENLELPILGAISRLTTQEEIDKEKYRKNKLITVALASSSVLIIAVMLYSFFKR
jgi:uncharacterized protein involved in exopolysaccharide biosynthesis